MRSTTRVIWSLVASLAHLSANVNHAMVHAAGDVLEVDLLFPRDNQTYAPTSYMPIVFALQKAELARHIYPVIEFRVRNLSDPGEGQGRTYHQALDFPNGTISDSEPWLVHTLVDNFAAAGTWTVVWDLWWESCRWEEGFDGQPLFAGRVQGNVSTGVPGAISFHTTDGGQALDLVAATADEKACHAAGEPGRVLNVTDELRNVTDWQDAKTYPTCVTVSEFEGSEPSLQLCSVKINSTAAAAISASVKDRLCQGKNPPTDCPSKPSTASRLGVVGAAYLAAGFGALGFLSVLA